jgi:molybdate transport system substrate-binding protein
LGTWFVCALVAFFNRITEGTLSKVGAHHMRRINFLLRYATLLGVFWALQLGNCAKASELHVLATTALKPFFEQMTSNFEKTTGHRLKFVWGTSFGTASDALPVRIKNGETADLVIMIGTSIDEQIKLGYLRKETASYLATSRIGLAVKSGIPKPDITNIDNLRHTLLAAKSVAYSSGVSGVYAAGTMFPQLGIADQLKSKSVVVEVPELVGHALLRGDAEVGLQQMSELMAVPGIQIVGPLPDAVQRVNVIAAAVAKNAAQPQAAEALITFLQGSNAAQKLKASGFDPIILQ